MKAEKANVFSDGYGKLVSFCVESIQINEYNIRGI